MVTAGLNMYLNVVANPVIKRARVLENPLQHAANIVSHNLLSFHWPMPALKCS